GRAQKRSRPGRGGARLHPAADPRDPQDGARHHHPARRRGGRPQRASRQRPPDRPRTDAGGGRAPVAASHRTARPGGL
ncbi:MAG: hypothetical protein AVDCRST_MAG31-238, partial [uncultured Sphingomonas sp.]